MNKTATLQRTKRQNLRANFFWAGVAVTFHFGAFFTVLKVLGADAASPAPSHITQHYVVRAPTATPTPFTTTVTLPPKPVEIVNMGGFIGKRLRDVPEDQRNIQQLTRLNKLLVEFQAQKDELTYSQDDCPTDGLECTPPVRAFNDMANDLKPYKNDPLFQLLAINAWGNIGIAYNKKLVGKNYEPTAREGLEQLAAICKQQAFLKAIMALKAGIPARNIYLLEVVPLKNRELIHETHGTKEAPQDITILHLIVAIKVDGRLLIMNNQSDGMPEKISRADVSTLINTSSALERSNIFSPTKMVPYFAVSADGKLNNSVVFNTEIKDDPYYGLFSSGWTPDWDMISTNALEPAKTVAAMAIVDKNKVINWHHEYQPVKPMIGDSWMSRDDAKPR